MIPVPSLEQLRPTRDRLWAVILGIGLISIIPGFVIPEESETWHIAVYLPTVLAFLIYLAVLAKYIRGPSLQIWIPIGLFQFFNLIADTIYNYNAYVLKTETGGWSDVFYFAAYISAFVALVLLIRTARPGKDRETWIDATVLTLAAASIIIALFLAPILVNPDIPTNEALITIAYPLLDLAILSSLARVIIGLGRPTLTTLLFTGAFGAYLLADLVYNFLLLQGMELQHAAYLEAMYVIANFILTAALASPGANKINEPTEREAHGKAVHRSVLALSFGAAASPIVLAYILWFDADNELGKLLIIVSLITIFLVLWRLKILMNTIEEQSKQLSRQARTDSLTELPNRRTWDYQIERVEKILETEDFPVTLAIIDLDHFKRYNDTHGHQEADTLLTECAKAWRNVLPSSVFLARYGGEEFTVILQHQSALNALTLLEKVREATPGEQTASIGYAAREPGESLSDTLRRADLALYVAKENGRNRVEKNVTP